MVCEPRNENMPKLISHGVSSCTSETPKLPMPAWRPSAVPCMRLGKKYDVDGMKPENAPPPMPARNERPIRRQYGTSGLVTSKPQPSTGRISSSVVSVTSLRVPILGGSTIHTRRRMPPERPGMAASQYSCALVNSNPSAFSFGTMALGRNQATKHSVRVKVETVRVFQASFLSHLLSSSGSQATSQSPLVSVALMRVPPQADGRCCRPVRGPSRAAS